MLFFFKNTATTEIYTLSLHDALPMYPGERRLAGPVAADEPHLVPGGDPERDALHEQPGAGADLEVVDGEHGGTEPLSRDRKSTRLNSSHANISYAVFCLKKKNIIRNS